MSLLLLGASARVSGARIYGGPPFEGTVALRFVVLEHTQGIFVPQSNANLALHLNCQGVSTVTGRTDADGAWETRVPLGSCVGPNLSLELLANGIDRVIPSAEIPLHPPSFTQSLRPIYPSLSGTQTGDFKFSVQLARAIMATTFDETLILSLSQTNAQPASGAKIGIDGDVLVRSSRDDLHLDAQGSLRLVLRPLDHHARLEISASLPGNPPSTGSWSGELPVQAGAMWLDPDALKARTISVFAPVVNRAAYLTVFNQTSRIFSTRLELVPDQLGGANGSMPLPSFIPEPAWLLVCPDPPGLGHEIDTIAWPLSQPQPAAASTIHTPLLYDGMPAALSRARAKAILARRVATLVLALAAFIESALLFVKARQAKRELDALLSSQEGLDDAIVNVITGGHRFWLRLVGASLIVAVALSALALVVWIGPA